MTTPNSKDEPTLLEQTESHYLLYIPARQKDRAKSISGWRWDPDRLCWVFPRTGRIFDALMTEFGHDLDENKATRPSNVTRSGYLSFKWEEQELTRELRKAQKQLRTAQGLLMDGSDEKIKSALGDAYEQLDSLRRENDALRDEIRQYEEQVAARGRSIDQLRGESEKPRRQTPEMPPINPFHGPQKTAIIEFSGTEAAFAAILENTGLSDNQNSIDLTRIIENNLRKMLRAPDSHQKLYDLIIQARNANFLAPETIDLANRVRRQRNMIADRYGYSTIYLSRILLSLIAAALLLPEFPE